MEAELQEEASESAVPDDAAAIKSALTQEKAMGAFRKVPRTGVIYVMGEAARLGYRPGFEQGEDAFCNLGQGQPETGPLPGAPARCEAVSIGGDDQEYAPVAGV